MKINELVCLGGEHDGVVVKTNRDQVCFPIMSKHTHGWTPGEDQHEYEEYEVKRFPLDGTVYRLLVIAGTPEDNIMAMLIMSHNRQQKKT